MSWCGIVAETHRRIYLLTEHFKFLRASQNCALVNILQYNYIHKLIAKCLLSQNTHTSEWLDPFG